MTLDLNAVHADYEAWQKAHQAFDTDEWHLTANKLAGWVPDLIAALAAVEQDRDRLHAELADATGIRPDEAAALHRLLDAYLLTEERDPGLNALRRLRDRVSGFRQDHAAYAKYFSAEHSGTEADSPHASK